MLTLAQSGSQQLVPFRAHAGELSWFIDTLVLALVAGVAALVNVCQVASSGFINPLPTTEDRKGAHRHVAKMTGGLLPLQAKPSGPSS